MTEERHSMRARPTAPGLEALRPGLYARIAETVQPANTARQVGSGSVDSLATPEMIRLMEMAAVAAVGPHLPPGTTSVGTHVDARHLAATPVGMTVTVRAELTGVEGRRLTFHVTAHDDVGLVGEGIHTRVVVDVTQFEGRLAAKAQSE
jgi:fluoroacetyl-CoA thioesterase